ncbi:MAG: hypothetical protein ACREX4_07775 [Gammaproteobacteria bacterium]
MDKDTKCNCACSVIFLAELLQNIHSCGETAAITAGAKDPKAALQELAGHGAQYH